MQVKVWDNVSNIERTVTQKAFDIIVKNKRKPRYEIKSYIDDDGNEVQHQAQSVAAPEKKTEHRSEVVQAVADSHTANSGETFVFPGNVVHTGAIQEGITVIRKKPGPKPKSHA